MREINKRRWSHFCKDMTRLNQFAKVKALTKKVGGKENIISEGAIFLGLELGRTGKKITSIIVKIGQPDPNLPVHNINVIESPVSINHQIAPNGKDDKIEIIGEDGSKVLITVSPESKEEIYNSLVSDLAYSLAEVRDFVPGHEWDDWFTAERLIRDTAQEECVKVIYK